MSTPSDALPPADPAHPPGSIAFIEDASGAQDPPPPIKGVRRLLWWIIPGNLAIFLIWGAVPGILLPQQITLLDPDPVRKVANLAVVMTISAFAAMLAQPIAGQISDRTRSRFGRRAPWMFLGSLAGGLSLVGLAFANSIVGIAIGWILVQVAYNFAQGPLNAIMPDRVPISRRGTFAAFVLMAVAVAVNPSAPFTQGLDAWWRGIIGQGPDDTLYRGPVAMFFQDLGQIPGAILTIIVIPLVLVLFGRWRSALFFLAALLLCPLVLSQVTKNLVNRPRPAFDEAAGLAGPLFTVDHGSFPSGHAVTAGALAIAVAALIPPTHRALRAVWWVVAVLLVLGMMWQRTLINAHWLSDAFFGIVAGVVGALLMWWAFWPLFRADYGRPVWFLRRAQVEAEPIPTDQPAADGASAAAGTPRRKQ